MAATVAQSSANVTSALTRSPASTSGSQYLASSHMPSSGSDPTSNHRGISSSDSAASPPNSVAAKTSAV